jgi:hypothetical protein
MDRYAFRNFAALETAAQHEIWMKPMRPVELLAAIRITAAVGP